jgi:type I restriction enzyme S subunit
MRDVGIRDGWRHVAFGDVVRLSRERSSDPEGDGFQRYVGLEHMDPGELRVRRWGDVSEGTTFTSVFRAGQVLLGKRRAYQRKVSLADFDGVCSGDIYVLEAKKEHLLPELLPFICETDGFFEHAVRTSAGSLSPRTNWESLASYKFALPPLEDQRRMTAALAATLSAHDQFVVVEDSCDHLFSSLLEHRMRTSDGKAVALSEIASVERGKFSHRPRNLPEFYGGDAEFIQTGDVASSRGVLGPASQTLSELGKTYSRSFGPGTVMITIAAVIGATAVTTREVWCPDSVVGICPDQSVVDSRYLELALRRLRPLLDQREATTSTQKNINLGVLRPLQIPLVSLAEQEQIVNELEDIEHLRARLAERRANLRVLQRSIVTG